MAKDLENHTIAHREFAEGSQTARLAAKKPAPTLPSLLRRMRPHVKNVGHGTLAVEGTFRCAVRAAIVKAFEFAVRAQAKQRDPFFQTATLRGICEDFIALSFFATYDDRDEIIEALMVYNLADSVRRQTSFFAQTRPWQQVLNHPAGQHEESKHRVKEISASHSWVKNQLPTVKVMADKCDLSPLYEYMYAATSNLVHFRPGVLLRTGWSHETPNHQASRETRWTFSTTNFLKYYQNFNRVYSVYLTLLWMRKFTSEFSDQSRVKSILNEIDQNLDKILRWPELVTYEEMNTNPPNGYVAG